MKREKKKERNSEGIYHIDRGDPKNPQRDYPTWTHP